MPFGGRCVPPSLPQVYGLEWNPYEISHQVAPAFLTFGKKHIKVRAEIWGRYRDSALRDDKPWACGGGSKPRESAML